jgi:hypothetical protein
VGEYSFCQSLIGRTREVTSCDYLLVRSVALTRRLTLFNIKYIYIKKKAKIQVIVSVNVRDAISLHLLQYESKNNNNNN